MDLLDKKILEAYQQVTKEDLSEKWEKEVKIQKTGEHAGKTVAELKKQIESLKGKPGNKEKMGELLFALRAKQGWKKGKGATGLDEVRGEYPVAEKDYQEKMKIIQKRMKEFQTKLKKHAADFKKTPKNWGYVGDLENYIEKLEEMLGIRG